MRAIAASMVAIYHLSYHYDWSVSITNTLHFGAQGVELFFIISGFIIPFSLHQSGYKFKNIISHLGKRTIRLYPPFIFSCILIILSEMIFHNYIHGSVFEITFNQLIINWFLLAEFFNNIEWINPIYATLAVELQFYVLISLLFGLMMRANAIFLIVGILLILLSILTNDSFTVLSQAPFFLLGFCIFRLSKIKFDWMSLTLLIIIFISLFLYKTNEDFIVSLIASTFFLIPEKTKILRRTGEISYSFYLTHGLIGINIITFFGESEFSLSYPVVFIAFCFICSWGFAYVLFQIIERPYIRISKLIKYRK
jgi:peptidoglycan/LPS O-acetylase OafA/YrhL